VAKCPQCSGKMAFGAGRSVAPALVVTQEILVDLRDDKANRGDARLDQLIIEGESIQSTLHTVAHNMTALRIDWNSVKSWIASAATR
jgi:hypothetical protein